MLLYGAGGHAKVVIDCLLDGDIEVHGIFDDKSDLVSLNGFDVIGNYAPDYLPEVKVIITVGDNMTRQLMVQKTKHLFGTSIHKSAIVSRYAKIGEGSVIFHNSVIQTGVKIGKHCIVNTSSNIDHDVRIDDFVHISPNVTLCDNVEVQEGVHIGAGATVLPRVSIGKWCVIGAGAVITQNLPDYSLVIGVPGKVVRKLNQ